MICGIDGPMVKTKDPEEAIPRGHKDSQGFPTVVPVPPKIP
jgi:hypothetical protein